MDEYTRHLTPAPVPVNKLATVGDALDAVADHANECAARRRRFSMWAIGVGATLAGVLVTLGIFMARYLIVGAITLELDRRFPHMQQIAHRATPASLLPPAVAAEIGAVEVPK